MVRGAVVRGPRYVLERCPTAEALGSRFLGWTMSPVKGCRIPRCPPPLSKT